MGFKGSVESFSLADVFQNLAMNQQTGSLRVFTENAVEKNIYFENGMIRYLNCGAGKPLLTPEVFFARGLILKTNLTAALDRQRETAQPTGLCMVELGFITQLQLEETAKLQIEEEVFELFGWDKAQFEFNDGPPGEGVFAELMAHQGLSLPISHLIMEAARRIDEWDRLRRQLPSMKEIYCMELAVRRAIESGAMEMSAVEKRVAAMIDGGRDVEDLVEDSYLFKFEVLNALAGFIQSSLVRPAELNELHFAVQECVRLNLSKRRVKVLERILVLGGENLNVRKDLAESLAADQQVDKAAIHFLVLADAELLAKNEEGAMELYRRILTIAPKHVKAHQQLAATHSRRGKRRDAFIHYRELFEIFKDQNHLQEAKTAASYALECDPTQGDLRNALIELQLADNEKDAAAQQFEIMGDQAAKSGNVKVAAESYRRAIQFRPGQRILKKKLVDVMLSKEDRRARKRKLVIGLATFLVLGGTILIFSITEMANASAYSKAERESMSLRNQAAELEKNKNFTEAATCYQNAISLFKPVSKKFSVMGYNTKAKREIDDLDKLASRAMEKASASRVSGEIRAKKDLENAEIALRAGNIFDAREQFELVVKNDYASQEMITSANAKLHEIQKDIDRFEENKRRLKENPDRSFASIEEESSFKKAFLAEAMRNTSLNMDDLQIQLPLLVKTSTNGVSVYLDKKLLGSASSGGGREINTFRYSALETHWFEFKKQGYESKTINTAELLSPIFNLEMKRSPVTIDLRQFAHNISLSGSAVGYEDAIYTGTTDGSLLEITSNEKPIRRRFDMPSSKLNREVYGPIFIHKRTNKPDLIVYCSKAGDCVGLSRIAEGFKLEWRVNSEDLAPRITLSAKPSIMNLPYASNHPVLVLPANKRLFLIDCDSGLPVLGENFPAELKSSITSSATYLEQGARIVVGCEDGNMYGISPIGNFVEWRTNSRSSALRCKPTILDDQIVTGGDDGKLYFFNASNFDAKTAEIPLEGALSNEPMALRNKLYFGASLTDGFWCIDGLAHKVMWHKSGRDILGSVSEPAVALKGLIYFGTDIGRLYAVDEKGAMHWSYQIQGGKGLSCAPVVSENKVYFFTIDGRILRFDELE